MTQIKKIPYGDADFGKIIHENKYYLDKTKCINTLETLSDYIFLIRPRRFGKSLWINLLQYYYDINRKNEFESLFKDTFIGQNPTTNKNNYLTIAFNFSMVNPSISKVDQSFENHCQLTIHSFLNRYNHYFDEKIQNKVLDCQTTEEKLQAIFFHCSENKLKVYMFIDEYDNFTNTILATSGTDEYIKLTHGAGPYRFFFNLLKGLTSMPDSGLSKLFITGVSPVTMDDVTSGFNIGTNISLDTAINEFMGFTESETQRLIQYYHKAGALQLDPEFCMDIMKRWYNNYCFSPDSKTVLFNSDMVLFFLQKAISEKIVPKKLIDQNVKIDYTKLRHIITIDKQLNGNFSRLNDILEKQEIVSDIADSFPVEELTEQENFISLLYYFGLLTIHGTKDGVYLLKIPNITIQKLMYGYIRKGFQDVSIFKIDMWVLSKLIRDMAFRGDWKPFFQFISEQISKQTTIRDYLNGEKVIQGFLLAYLNVTEFYITHSEHEMNKGFSDIYMEPFIERYPDIKYSYLIELKYISRSKYSEEIQQRKIDDGQKQLSQYAQSNWIKDRINNNQLKKIIMIFKGWELNYYEEY